MSRALSPLVLLLCLAYLAGSLVTALAVGLFVVTVWLPFSLILWAAISTSIEARIAALIAATLSFAALVPLYFLRKLVPIPVLFDGALAVVLLSAAARLGCFQRLRDLGRLVPAPARGILLAVLPLFFAVSFLGYAVDEPNYVRYDGLFFKDFANLLSIATTIKASPGLPLAPVVDTGPLGYHWLFFVLPAWAARFLGLSGDTGHALVLCNLLSAALLFWVLTATLREALPHLSPSRISTGVLATFFASSTLYAYVIVRRALGMRPSMRNHLLLQLPQSLSTFGNNTFALGLCMLTLLCLRRYTVTGQRAFIMAAAGTTALLPGYSITLTFPLALTVAAIALGLGVGRAAQVLFAFALEGAVALAIFVAIGLFGYGSGGGGLALVPDGGSFLVHMVPALLPILLAFVLLVREQALRPLAEYLYLMGACLLVPSLLMTQGTPTADNDLSMKTASLFVVAAAPVLTWGIDRVLQRPRAGASLVMFALLSVGLLNTLAFSGKFIVYRVKPEAASSERIPRDHYAALRSAWALPDELVLVDELSLAYQVTDPALVVAEKRVLCGSGYEHVAFPGSNAAHENEQRVRGLIDGEYKDAALSRELAQRADLFISSRPLPRDGGFRELARFGEIILSRSTLR